MTNPDFYLLHWKYSDNSAYGIIAAYEVKEYAELQLERFKLLCHDKEFFLTPLSLE